MSNSSDKYSFHKNRQKIAYAIGVIVISIYALIETEGSPLRLLKKRFTPKYTQDSSWEKIMTPQIDIDILTDDIVIQETIKHYNIYKEPITIYTTVKEKTGPLLFCGARIKIITKNGWLDKIKEQRQEVQRILIGSEEEKNVARSIAWSNVGESFITCEPKFQDGTKVEDNYKKNMQASDIFCSFVTIESVEQQVKLNTYDILYKEEGYGEIIGCGDSVYLVYDIKNKEGKTLTKGKTKTFKIGTGTVPIQLEKAIINRRNKGVFILKALANNLQYVSFYGINDSLIDKNILSTIRAAARREEDIVINATVYQD